jgi:DNA-binding SARP family transcriptional activator
MVTFRVLGALEVAGAETVCTPSAPKARQVLALLALNAKQVVSLDQLIQELWDNDPPRSAVTTTQTYIYQVRRLMAREGLEQPGHELLVTKASGYILQTSPDQVDAGVFQRLVAEGDEHLRDRRAQQAARALRWALDLWRGPALADVGRGPLLAPYAVLLEEQRLRAQELRIQAELQLGRHRELIGELKSLVAQHPLNEWFHGQLIAALSRIGRRSDALQAYQHLRAVLRDQLGLDPTLELQRLQRTVLTEQEGADQPAVARAVPD